MNQQADNTLVLFVNQYKQTENQPDYKGKATVDGKEYKVAGWRKKGKNTGTDYLSVKLTPEIELEIPEPPKPQPKPFTAKRDDDDDIPF